MVTDKIKWTHLSYVVMLNHGKIVTIVRLNYSCKRKTNEQRKLIKCSNDYHYRNIMTSLMQLFEHVE